MGTGILAALNRNGSITPVLRTVDRVKKRLMGNVDDSTAIRDNVDDSTAIRDNVDDSTAIRDENENGVLLPLSEQTEMRKIWHLLFNNIGQFQSPKHLPATIKPILAQYFSYSEWARIALDVANQYPGGDYFEFGSEGLNTLCNFLAAFHLNGHDQNKPDVRCFAFDIFGDPRDDASLTSTEQTYFNVHRRSGQDYYGEMEKKLHDFGLMAGRVELIKGYFKDTLNDAFKSRLHAEKRRVGFAFLDCNIVSSYKTCFDFLVEFIREERAFIYMDEYFQIPGVATLFDEFCSAVLKRYGLKARYIRTAGAFGALFVLIGSPTHKSRRFFRRGSSPASALGERL